MGYSRPTAAAAVEAVLITLDATVSVFAEPPSTFNVPAYIVGYTRSVDYDSPAFGVDAGLLPVAAAVGVAEIDRLDELLDQAKKALNADPSLAGAVHSCRVRTQEQTRLWVIAGAEILAADLLLEIQQ
jgi:hypothetical protein